MCHKNTIKQTDKKARGSGETRKLMKFVHVENFRTHEKENCFSQKLTYTFNFFHIPPAVINAKANYLSLQKICNDHKTQPSKHSKQKFDSNPFRHRLFFNGRLHL